MESATFRHHPKQSSDHIRNGNAKGCADCARDACAGANDGDGTRDDEGEGRGMATPNAAG